MVCIVVKHVCRFITSLKPLLCSDAPIVPRMPSIWRTTTTENNFIVLYHNTQPHKFLYNAFSHPAFSLFPSSATYGSTSSKAFTHHTLLSGSIPTTTKQQPFIQTTANMARTRTKTRTLLARKRTRSVSSLLIGTSEH